MLLHVPSASLMVELVAGPCQHQQEPLHSFACAGKTGLLAWPGCRSDLSDSSGSCCCTACCKQAAALWQAERQPGCKHP